MSDTHPPAKKRRRPALACVQCRRRKIRCDQNMPCDNCVKAHISDCTFPHNHISTLRSNSAARNRSSTTHNTPDVHQGEGQGVSGLTPRPTPREPPQADNSEIAALLAKIDGLERTISSLRHDADERNIAQPVVARREQSPGPRFSNQSTWVNNTGLYTQVMRTLKRAQSEKGGLDRGITACSSLGQRVRRLTAVDAGGGGGQFAELGRQMPDRSLADRLLESYSDTFGCIFPVLDVKNFRSEYEEFWRNPTGRRDIFVLQLQLCLSLGTMADEDSLPLRKAASCWVAEARNWLRHSSRQSRKGQGTLEELQLESLVVVAETNGPGSQTGFWSAAGDLVRKAMGLDLHRDPDHLAGGGMSMRQAELRRQLWMTILELNLLSSLQASKPPMITSKDYDTRPPADPCDAYAGQFAQATTRASSSNQASLFASLALFESYTLRVEIANLLTAIGEEIALDEALRLHKALSKVMAKLQERCVGPDPGSPPSVLPVTILSYYMLALHMPILGKSIKDPAHHFCRRVASTVASQIIHQCATTIRPSPRSPGQVTMSLMFSTSMGFLRHIMVQATFSLALELVTLKEEQAEDAVTFPIRSEVELFREMDSLQDWLEKRMSMGPVDFHWCCLLAAARSYAAELTAEGTSVEGLREAMTQAAVQSSERCRVMLEGVVRELQSTDGNAEDRVAGSQEQMIGPGAGELPNDWVDDPMLGSWGDALDYDWAYQEFPVNATSASGTNPEVFML